MTKGNGLFIFLIVLGVAAFALDRSQEPMLSLVANGYELILVFCGTWKLVELFNGKYKK